jgi:hypothetical protein
LIVYWAVPYLLAAVAVPPIIVLLSILLCGCTMTRASGEPMEATDRGRFYSEAHSRAGVELVRELDRRAARAQLQRTIEEAQR